MSKPPYRRFIIKALCLLSLSFYLNCGVAFGADSSAVSGIGDNLDKLETKLFQHTYAKDNPDDRLNRLENLIFGQSEKGTQDERLASLLKAVPNIDSVGAPVSAPVSGDARKVPSVGAPVSAPTSDRRGDAIAPYKDDKDNADNVADQSKYPAVSAMETKLLGKDYAGDPIKDRLARLEKKVLGKVSDSDDLSDRVDHLKQATGIDVAKRSGSTSDWLEDNDDMLMQQPTASANAPATSFPPQDIYQDMQKAYNAGQYPFNTAYYPDTPAHAPVSIKSFGLSQQVSALEHEIFHKTYEHDPLPARLNRLESAVFPDQKPAVDKPLPQRVDNLLAKVPISQKELQNLAVLNGIDTKGGFDQSTNTADASNSANANTPSKQHSSLGKLMNSIGNMLSGSGMTGSYPMSGGNYVVDPKTGMLVNPATGTVINPNTGTIYGANPYNQGYSPYGYSPYNMGGFGMSPFGSPYGMGSGFGFGGSGMGMGFGIR